MSAFTPGPWKVGGVDQQIWIERSNPNDACICDIVQSGLADGEPVYADEDEANARLIAAAPDLYEAVAEYVAWGAMTSSDRDRFAAKFAAALAKADSR